MFRLLLGLGIGYWLASRATGKPAWWTDVMTRAFAADQVTVRRDALADAASAAAAAAGVPVQWVVEVAEKGAKDLSAAAQKMAALALSMGPPADSLPATLAAYRSKILAGV